MSVMDVTDLWQLFIMQESLARDLEKEVASLEAHAQGMQEQSAKTDTALRVSKDQYVRLTADFENFRKRSVSVRPCMDPFSYRNGSGNAGLHDDYASLLHACFVCLAQLSCPG